MITHIPHSPSHDTYDDDGDDDDTYTSPHEHPLEACYRYKTVKEQKQCVKDMYDNTFGWCPILIMSIIIVVLLLVVIGEIE